MGRGDHGGIYRVYHRGATSCVSSAIGEAHGERRGQLRENKV